MQTALPRIDAFRGITLRHVRLRASGAKAARGDFVMRAGRLGMIALLSSFQAVAQTASAEPPVEQTSVVCDAFQRIDGGDRWVVLWPVRITIEGKATNLDTDTPIARGTPLDGVDVAGVLEKICHGENPHEVQTEHWRRSHRRGRK